MRLQKSPKRQKHKTGPFVRTAGLALP